MLKRFCSMLDGRSLAICGCVLIAEGVMKQRLKSAEWFSLGIVAIGCGLALVGSDHGARVCLIGVVMFAILGWVHTE
jgi:hypothetical protein